MRPIALLLIACSRLLGDLPAIPEIPGYKATEIFYTVKFEPITDDKPKPVEPKPVDIFPIVVATGDLAFNEKPRTVYSTLNEHTLVHGDSGDNIGFSFDNRWLSLLSGTTWYAIGQAEDNRNEVIELIGRNEHGGQNINLVWGTSAAQYYRIRENKLERCDVKLGVLNSAPLPPTLPGPTGDEIQILYRLQTGSNQANPVITISTNDGKQNGVLVFDPQTCEVKYSWWIQQASTIGFQNNKALAIGARGHNLQVTNLGGIPGIYYGLDASFLSPGISTQHVQHWSPLDGSDCIQIEGGSNGSRNYQTHQSSFENLMCVGDLALEAGIVVGKYGNPPSLSNFERIHVLRDQLLVAFPDQTNPRAIGQHHSCVNKSNIVASLVNWSTGWNDLALVSIDPSTGEVEVIDRGLTRKSFLSGPRPTIDSSENKRTAYHRLSESGFVEVVVLEGS